MRGVQRWPQFFGEYRRLQERQDSRTPTARCRLQIHWFVEECRLLREEVVIIDSHGIDVEADLPG